MSETTPAKHDGSAVLFAVAELLVFTFQYSTSCGKK